MTAHSYGFVSQTKVNDRVAQHAEEISAKGFTVLPDLFPREGLLEWRARIDSIYTAQEREFGRPALAAMKEEDVCRAPLLRDFRFLELATHPDVLAVVQSLLGPWFILNLQNAVINRPSQRHHQSAWHRDLPHQNFVSSRPLAISALVAVDAFSLETGGTQVLPFTHRMEALPSDVYIRENHVAVWASAGSVIVFDAMMFHRAGTNSSAAARYGVNHVYTVPILKQQYDFPRALGSRADMTVDTRQLLGYTSQVPLDDTAWRQERAERLAGTPS